MEGLRILFVALYSDQYPSIGESHGTSVVAGAVANKCSDLPIEYLEVIDMVAFGEKRMSSIIEKIETNKPNVIGFSVNYGTYDILKEIFEKLNPYIILNDPLILFGGAIASYIPNVILDNVYKKAIIVIGEGDEAAPSAIRAWYKKQPFELIPNLCLKNENDNYLSPRRLVSIDKLSPPYRNHIDAISKNKAQVYIESSRGCSWAGCTFCLRGLTDVNGTRSEYRRFHFERLSSDLLNLHHHGISVFTFADEDFLGGNIEDNEEFISEFENFCMTNKLELSFDASLTVHSIYSDKLGESNLNKIYTQLIKLKKCGLRKIFLGIESGSNTQLKRYAKGHSSKEALKAINIIQSLGFTLELGFIMFDPLCTLNEIEENIDFLYSNDLSKYVSFLSNELRLQIQSNFIKILDLYEKKSGTIIYERTVDYNTISHNYFYANKEISVLVDTIQYWNLRLRNLHYPLKNLSRYGDGGILGNLRSEVFDILADLRNGYLSLIKEEIKSLQNDGRIERNKIENLLQNSAIKIVALSEKATKELLENNIFNNILKYCEGILANKLLVSPNS